MSNSEYKLDIEDENENNYQIDFLQIQKASLILQSLNNESRHQIFQLIQDDGPLTVSEIQAKLKLQQLELDEHLGILRRANFVHIVLRGDIFYYSINKQRINDILNMVTLHLTS